MLTLLRWWLLPRWLRRIPPWALVMAAALWALWLVPLPISIRDAIYNGVSYDVRNWLIDIPAELARHFLGALASTLGLIAGASSIVRDRQKETWQPLATTLLRPNEIMAARATCVWVKVSLLTMPAYIIVFRSTEITSNTGARLFMLGWVAGETILRILTFIVLGMAVSICCKRVQSALFIVSAPVIAYATAFVMAANVPNCYQDVDDPHWYSHIFYWPALETTTYSVPEHWQLRVVADLFWAIGVPLIAWLFLRRSFAASVRG